MENYPSESLLGKLLSSGWDQNIKNKDEKIAATMRIVTPEMVDGLTSESPLIVTLCDWRNVNRNNFFDSREVTPESTLGWLRNISKSPDRLIFIIYDLSMRPIAQYALRRFDEESIELDNGILGVNGLIPDVFYKIQIHILDLIHRFLGFERARALVLSSNIPALFLHKRCGLRKTGILKNESNGQDVLVMSVDLKI